MSQQITQYYLICIHAQVEYRTRPGTGTIDRGVILSERIWSGNGNLHLQKLRYEKEFTTRVNEDRRRV
jgi:hypothetical protein